MNKLVNQAVGAWLLLDGNNRERLAKELGITRPTLNGRLKGESAWTWDEVLTISELTGNTLDELAGR